MYHILHLDLFVDFQIAIPAVKRSSTSSEVEIAQTTSMASVSSNKLPSSS